MATLFATPLFSPLALSLAKNRHFCSTIRCDSKHGKSLETNGIKKLNLSKFRKIGGQSSKFLQMGSQEMSFERNVSVQAMDGAGTGNPSTISNKVSLKMNNFGVVSLSRCSSLLF